MAQIDVKFMKRNAKKTKLGDTYKPIKTTKKQSTAKKSK